MSLRMKITSPGGTICLITFDSSSISSIHLIYRTLTKHYSVESVLESDVNILNLTSTYLALL